MNYADFKVRDRRLHLAYHRAKRTGDEATMHEVRAEEDQLDRENLRKYQISDRMEITVYVRWITITISARRTDTGINLCGPGGELDRFNAEELRTLAVIRDIVQRYEDGKLEELPFSGAWPPAEPGPGSKTYPIKRKP